MENKYNELEKLNQLKSSGTITEEEFEIQKSKMLNSQSNIKKTKKDKKKIIKILVAVIVSIIIIVLGILSVPNIKIKSAAKKLSNINTQELQLKIIKRLEKSPLNINNGTTKTEFRTLDGTKTELEKIMEIGYETADVYNNEVLNNGKKVDRPYNTFISAYIYNKEKDSIGVAIPCFSIQSDDSGNVKSIEYWDYYNDSNFIGAIIRQEIENVLKMEYNIDTKVVNDLIYKGYKKNRNINFERSHRKICMDYNDEEFLVNIFKTIHNNMGGNYGTYDFSLSREKDKFTGKYRYKVDVTTLLMMIK